MHDSKDETIRSAVLQLRARLGANAFDVRDHWTDDQCAIGLSARNEPGRLIYISTFGRPPGRFDVAFELPPVEGSEHPYTPAGEQTDVDMERLVSLVATHLRVS